MGSNPSLSATITIKSSQKPSNTMFEGFFHLKTILKLSFAVKPTGRNSGVIT